MAPKQSITSSSKSKWARVEVTSPDPNSPNILPFLKRLSITAPKWVTNRESLKIISEKSFDKVVIEHFKLEQLSGGLGWVPLLLLYGNYYPNLVREFYANMTYKTDKDLEIIFSTLKGVRIILTRERLISILGIQDEGNMVTIDSNKKSIDKDPDWSIDASCQCFGIWPCSIHRCRIFHVGDFRTLLPRALSYFFGYTLVQKEGGPSDVRTFYIYVLDKIKIIPLFPLFP